jgi:hypothetical protein
MRLISAVALGVITLAGARSALAAEPDVPTQPLPAEETWVPRVGFNIGGGLSIPISDAGDRFQTGGSFQLGFTYSFSSRLGVQAEYLYSSYDIQGEVLNETGVEGSHVMQYGDLNAIYRVLLPQPLGVYLVAGPGIYYRRVTLAEIAGTAVVPYCDPWLYICYGDTVAVADVLGTRSRTDFGLNAGVGVSLRIFGGPISLYAEARYHYIFSGDIDTPAGPKKATGQYLPIVLGFRF